MIFSICFSAVFQNYMRHLGKYQHMNQIQWSSLATLRSLQASGNLEAVLN